MSRAICILWVGKGRFMVSLACLLIAGVWNSGTPSAGAESVPPAAIPYKPDPPPAIDGRLDDWTQVPVVHEIGRREQAVYGGNKWRSPQDLSAKLHFAWRDEYLYLAAEVTDDQHRQPGRGLAMYRGDHITLYLDLDPLKPRAGRSWGDGLLQLGFSPGTLTRSGDALTDLAPEAVVFYPEGKTAEGVLVAAQKTETGYTLEAAIPWVAIFKLAGRPAARPASGLPVSLEVGISDCDAPEPAQEKMMTILTAPWGGRPPRMLAAVLAPADGKAPPIAESRTLAGQTVLAPGKTAEIAFEPLAPPPGSELVLSLKARIPAPRAAGYTAAMMIHVNGQALDAKRLLNWQREETRVDGRSMNPAAGETFNVPYSPDFDAPNRHPNYALTSGPKLCRYELRITDLVQPGKNVVVFKNNSRGTVERDLLVDEVRLTFGSLQVARAKRPAPQGPLPEVVPQKTVALEYGAEQRGDARLEVTLGRDRFQVESEFSTPAPAWVKGDNAYFTFRRRIQRTAEAVLVHDTFANRTGENLPLVQRHRLSAAGPWKGSWLGGFPVTAAGTGISSDPAHPTSFGTTANGGAGLLALDDVFQVHAVNFSSAKEIGLADHSFVLRPHAEHTAEWAIVLTPQPEYFAFVNAVRRLRDVNFTLPGSFAFLRASPNTPDAKWTDAQLTDFIHFKNAYFVCGGISWPRYHGLYPHGTAFQLMDWSYAKERRQRIRRLVPEARHLTYYHCFIDVTKEGPEKYRDARLLQTDGSQADYGKPHDRIYVPTLENSFGKDVAKNVDLILAPMPAGLGCDGVYWDEFEYSRYPYAYGQFDRKGETLPWDGASADIDLKRLTISRLKSSVTLISQPFRLALVERIQKGNFLVANGQPHTQTMVRRHFPRFVETGSISNCVKAQLYSPIALGDHLTERSEEDAYQVMLRALDFGCLYYWYNDLTVVPTHPHLTSYMFPITLMELHPGYVIGRERIVTRTSGLFGWGDRAEMEVHVFDDRGREVPDFKAPRVMRGAQTFVELRLPEDYSAAIVRKPGK